MSNALPPLNSLRAFEVAARHGNFARAALELNVTPGALSHQIRGLEGMLGVALFERQARGVTLTAQGQALFPGVRAAFSQIRDSVNAVRAHANGSVVVVSAPPGFISKWLAPRLYRFAQAHPDIELRIASSAAYASFVNDGVDVAVRSVPSDRPREAALEYEKLIDDEMTVVCSATLLAAMKPKQRGGPDVRKTPLIHDDQLAGRPEVPTWGDWFRAARLAPPDLRRGLRFSSAEHAIEAAVQGAGLLLTHIVLARDDLACGRLVMPFDVVMPGGRSYFLVRPKAMRARKEVDAFGAWLRVEITATE